MSTLTPWNQDANSRNTPKSGKMSSLRNAPGGMPSYGCHQNHLSMKLLSLSPCKSNICWQLVHQRAIFPNLADILALWNWMAELNIILVTIVMRTIGFLVNLLSTLGRTTTNDETHIDLLSCYLHCLYWKKNSSRRYNLINMPLKHVTKTIIMR